MELEGSAPLEGFLIILRSASSTLGANLARRQIEDNHLKQVSAALRGPHTAERAALILAVTAGIQMMRQMIGLSPLVKADPKLLSALLTRVFGELVQ